MAYHPQASFAAGELDPALQERTTLEKYQSGLRTLRNAFIGKTGRIISRMGLLTFGDTHVPTRKSLIYSPPYSNYIIEWGHLYVTVYNRLTNVAVTDAHDFVEDDVPYLQFAQSGKFLYIFRLGKKMKKMVLEIEPGNPPYDHRFLTDIEIINQPFVVDPVTGFPNWGATNGGTGYPVCYQVTFIVAGEESAPGPIIPFDAGAVGFKLPILATESNNFDYGFNLARTDITEMRVYRRPTNGNAFGYIGSAGPLLGSSIPAVREFRFYDFGQDADYSHSPPTVDFHPVKADQTLGPIEAKGRTGAIYQQRLVLTEFENQEKIVASRPGQQNNFTREYPLSDDSSLTFKSGTTGSAKVLRLMDNNGLMAFTTVGIYSNGGGALGINNLGMDKKGSWVIDELVPPLEVPGGVLFVDKETGKIRSLIFSNEAGGFPGDELSIFSNHLFVGKRVVSWAFQTGEIPLIWVVLDDGSLLSFTYQREQQMQAWAHHDTEGGKFECVTVHKSLDTQRATAYFIVNRNGLRGIEYTAPRFVTDIKNFIGMDCAHSYNGDLRVEGTTFNIQAEDPLDWEGRLRITATPVGAPNSFQNTAGNGAAGTVYRHFDKDGSAIDLTVVIYLSAGEVIVEPDVLYPFDETTNINLYKTFKTLTGLNRLEGKSVSILADGYVLASPNNDIDNTPEVRVVGGQLTLPGLAEDRYSIIQVGIPVTADVETLDLDTVEQKPTLLESLIVHKVYMKTYNSRGLYIGSKLPDDGGVGGLEDIESRKENLSTGNIGNAAQAPSTERKDVPIPNDWESRGRIVARQVDPLPFEILSIIPDLLVEY